MRKYFSKAGVYLTLSLFLLFTACQKQVDTQLEEPLLAESFAGEAKAWFANGPVLKERKMLEQSFSALPENSPQRFFARMAKLHAKLQWNDAKQYNREGLAYLVVPVSLNSKLFGSDYDFAKTVVFSKKGKGAMKAYVLEILSKKGASLSLRQTEIAATAFYNQELNKKENITGLNAYVFFYDENYKKHNGFEVKDGVWVATKTTLVVGKNKRNPASSNNITESVNCVLWGLFLDHYDQNGVLLYSQLLYTYWVCDDDGQGPGADPIEHGDPREGGGNGHVNPTTQTRYVQFSSSENESAYTEEDELSTGGYSPITYTHQATIAEVDPSGEILNILIYPTTASPMIGAYVDKYNRNVTRKLTLFNHYNHWLPIGVRRAMVTWSCSVIGVNSYTDGSPTWTRQWNHTKSAVYN